MPPSQTDHRLALGYGSAWHLLRCLGWRRERFTELLVRQVPPVTGVTWLDFPPYAGARCYPRDVPIRDGEWKRLKFIRGTEAEEGYGDFWPAAGEQQNWDAVGRASTGGETEWLLVEAKAHPAEIKSDGTDAKEDGGRPTIRKAFAETLQALGYQEAEAAAQAETWLTGYYQHANRLAALHHLRRQGVPARLVFLYFCGDRHPDGKFCPATPDDWRPHLAAVKAGLGFRGGSALETRVHDVFVDVNLATDYKAGG